MHATMSRRALLIAILLEWSFPGLRSQHKINFLEDIIVHNAVELIGTLNLLTKKQNSIIRSSCRDKNATPRTRRSEFAIFTRYKPDRYALEFFAHRPAEKYCFSSPYWIPKTVDLNLRKRRSQFRFCLWSLDQTIFPFSELRCHISEHLFVIDRISNNFVYKSCEL